MKKILLITSIALALLGCSQKVALQEHEKTKKNHQKHLAYLQMFDVHSDITLLESLRENRIEEAIELLEGELDSDIVILNDSLKKEQDQKSINNYLEALRRARNYRGKYPKELALGVPNNPNRNADFFKRIVDEKGSGLTIG